MKSKGGQNDSDAKMRDIMAVNERQAAQIEALLQALADAEVKIADQEKRILSLKKQIGFQQMALTKAKRRTGKQEQGPALSTNP